MIVEVNGVIDRTAGEVFDAMADARNEPAWNTQVSKTELVSELPIGEGTVFTTVNRGQTYEARIETYDRPHLLRFVVTGKPMAITGELTFAEDSAGSTAMRARFDLEPRGFMRVMFPLMKPLIRKDLPKQIASFKAFCESAPPS